jgi:hypothetical protein
VTDSPPEFRPPLKKRKRQPAVDKYRQNFDIAADIPARRDRIKNCKTKKCTGTFTAAALGCTLMSFTQFFDWAILWSSLQKSTHTTSYQVSWIFFQAPTQNRFLGYFCKHSGGCKHQIHTADFAPGIGIDTANFAPGDVCKGDPGEIASALTLVLIPLSQGRCRQEMGVRHGLQHPVS